MHLSFLPTQNQLCNLSVLERRLATSITEGDLDYDHVVKQLEGMINSTRRRKFSLIIDTTLPREEMVMRGGYGAIYHGERFARPYHFDFPSVFSTGIKKVVAQLVYIGCPATSDEAEEEVAKRGLRPAYFDDLLAFGAQFPESELHLGSPVVALTHGRLVSYVRHETCLSIQGNQRFLHLSPSQFRTKGKWQENCLFLGIEEKAPM